MLGRTCGPILASLLFASASLAQSAAELRGAWKPELYRLKDGAEHRVDGRIFFTETDWTVLFFVLDESGEPRRGSGEGGTYRLEGDALTFTHFYHLSRGEEMAGLEESPLRMSVTASADADADAAEEPCRIAIEGERLTIFFPSGNQMTFRRSSQ